MEHSSGATDPMDGHGGLPHHGSDVSHGARTAGGELAAGTIHALGLAGAVGQRAPAGGAVDRGLDLASQAGDLPIRALVPGTLLIGVVFELMHLVSCCTCPGG